MFTPLHTKSDYSLGYGTASIEYLVARAVALGYTALALTDLENLGGQVRFQRQCRAHGIKAITGVELRTGFGVRSFGNKGGRLVLLAADLTGYRSLCRIVSRRRIADRPRTGGGTGGDDPVPIASANSEGLFALSDDPQVIERLLSLGNFQAGRLGLLCVRPGDRERGIHAREVARRLGVRPVADLDAVFLDEEDHRLHLLQAAIRQGMLISETTKAAEVESMERRLRPPAEVESLFQDFPEALIGAADIADACRFDMSALKVEPPTLQLPAPQHPRDLLRRLCSGAVDRRLRNAGAWTSAYSDRLEMELRQFERLGLCGFILIVNEIVAHCRDSDIPVVARGSAVSSLTLHLLGATPVDPVADGLLFERFLHERKSSWPDVDLDLPWHRREEVIDWVYRRFGRDRVATAGAYHTFQRRSALRDGLKAFGFKTSHIEELSRNLPSEDLAVAEFDFLDLADEIVPDDVAPGGRTQVAGIGLGNVLPLVQRLIGRPRHLAAHPGGIVIGNGPLEDVLPLDRVPKGIVATQCDLTALEDLGIIKIDLLGNRCLSELEETLRLAGNPNPSNLEAIPENDPVTLALVDRAETIGCFQLESPAMRSLLTKIPIRSQNDITAALALIRPGASAGAAKAAFIRHARGEEKNEPFDPEISDRLGETHGMLLYEEDIMALLSRAGGVSLAEADELRSAIIRSAGNPEVLAGLEREFLNKCSVSGRCSNPSTLARARSAWAAVARFAAYSFNKAHAASYGRLAYLSAYMKAHHPVEFACALLNHHQGIYPLRTLAADLMRGGVELKAPHVNSSGYLSCLEDGYTPVIPAKAAIHLASVRIGLEKIKGLTSATAENILENRAANGLFTTLRNFLNRVKPSRTETAALVLSGACDRLHPLLPEWYPFVHEAALEILKKGGTPAAVDSVRAEIPQRATTRPQSNPDLYAALVRVRNELRYLEMHLSAHPTALLRKEAERYGCVPIQTAAASKSGARVCLLVIMAAMRRVPTRSGILQFLTLEDETGLLEAAVLPPAYRAMGDKVTTPGPFLVEGTLKWQQDAAHLEVFNLSPFHQRNEPFGA